MSETKAKSIDLSKAIAALRVAKKELMIATVRPMLEKSQIQELATRLGEISYTIKKLEAME